LLQVIGIGLLAFLLNFVRDRIGVGIKALLGYKRSIRD
jgi:hypothetical protein